MKKDKYQVAVELFNSEKFDKAKEILYGLVRMNARDFDAYNFLGIIELKEKNYKKSLEYFNKVLEIKRDHPNVYYNIGMCLQCIGEIEQAINAYKNFYQTNQNHLDVLNNLGLLYVVDKKYELAEEHFKKANKLNPNEAKILLNYSNLLFAKLRYDDILNLDKNISEVSDKTSSDELVGFKINVAKALFNKGRIDDSLILLESLLQVSPVNSDVMLNIANIFLFKSDNDKAKFYFNKLLNTRLESAGYNGLGLIELRNMNLDKAEHFFREAIKREPETSEFHYNLSHALLLKGNLDEGFKEYEWRKKRDEFLKREFSKPELSDEDIYGKRILVWDEQGIGDIIQFIRYFKILKQRGAIVIFQCAAGVINLIENAKYIDTLLPRNSTEEPDVEYDFQISLLSLPKYFNTTLETIPTESKYIFAKQDLVNHWKNHFQQFDKKKIGIVWAGNPKHSNDKNRSIKLKYFSKLFRLSNCQFFSLQKGFGLEQSAEFSGSLIVLDNKINNLSDTAAIIENLDLVISVDTSVAHLSAALGKETFVLLPFSPDWRWMAEINYSPWYSTMKLFRQQKEGDWGSVFDVVQSALKGNSVLAKTEFHKEKTSKNKIFLGLTSGENFGWGVCSKYLKKELAKKNLAESLEEYYSVDDGKKIEGKVFHGLTDIEFNSIYRVRGKQNYGYTFFENELLPVSVENAKKYDVVIGGSTWCKEKMEAKGILNTDVLIQGIDPELFYPIHENANEKLFVIFSGGKFELRKGQDLVLKAVKHIQDKYANVILINAWYNFWPQSIATMSKSSHIKFDYKGSNWAEIMNHIYEINGLNSKQIFTLPVTPNEKLRELYAKTDIGIFPNRCEGGTNLVMMEYMACGKPIIASYSSGHTDVLNENNSLMLKEMKEFQLFENGKMYADWNEPSLDELIDRIEFAYNNREKIKAVGQNAGKFMRDFTWSNTAEKLIKIITD